MQFLVFDLDDTLFPEKEFVRSGFQSVGAWVHNSYGIEGFYEIASRLFESGVRGNTFNLALHELGLEDDQVLIQKMIEIYRSHKPSLSLHQDAQWAINHYRDQFLGIITDGFLQVQQNKTEALGLNSYFSNIIYSDSYGRVNWKPSPLPYLEMMRFRSCQGAKWTYVGDNPRKDFVTAKKLGWRTIHICRPEGEYSEVIVDKSHQADIKIESLYELSNIV